MKKVIAMGFLILAIMIGSVSVIAGTVTDTEILVWLGMVIIAIGVVNLLLKMISIEPKYQPKITIVQKKVRKVVKKKSKSRSKR
jgi:cytochrome c biogenesis protein CcdA